MAVPFDTAAQKGQQPDDGLKQIFDRHEPGIPPRRRRGRASVPASPIFRRGLGLRGRSPSQVGILAQPMLEMHGSHNPDREADEDGNHYRCNRTDNQPEEGPEGCVAQDAEEIR